MFALSGIDRILEKIRQDGRDQEKAVYDGAKKQAEQMLDEAKEQAQTLILERTENAEKAALSLKSQRMSQRESARKLMILREKRSQLDRSFVLAKEAVLNLSLPKYERFLEHLLAGIDLSHGELLLSARDSERLNRSGFIKKLRHKNIRLSKEFMQEEGGFLIRRGKVVSNRSLAALFAEKKESLEPEIAEILFGEEGK